ncbi:chemotaxis protein CheD [bacterium]|nr:chemotaxis protein CheD [bacterium]
MGKIIRVAIADLGVAKADDRLFTVVGSCIAIMLYDKVKRIGGMLHIMLGYSRQRQDNICKYADSGIPYLIDCLVKSGAGRQRIQGAKIAGGSVMLAKTDQHNIAVENRIATYNVLQKHDIKVIASDCGGDFGRRITFDTATGKVQIESRNGYLKTI